MQYITVSDVHKYWPITNSCTVFRQSTAEVKRYRNWSISGHWSNTLIVSNTISHLRNEIIDMVLRYQSSQNRVLLPCSWEGAKYCDDVCLAACKPPKPHVAYRWRPLAAWQLQYRMLCTSSFVDDITFSHSCPYGASHVFLSCDGTQNSWDTHKILLNDREQMYALWCELCTGGKSAIYDCLVTFWHWYSTAQPFDKDFYTATRPIPKLLWAIFYYYFFLPSVNIIPRDDKN